MSIKQLEALSKIGFFVVRVEEHDGVVDYVIRKKSFVLKEED